MQISTTGQNNNQALPDENIEWLDMKTAAKIYGCSPSALIKLIKKYRPLLGDQVKGGEIQGRRVTSSKKGLFELRNIAGVKSRKENIGYLTEQHEFKQRVAEKLIEQAAPHEDYMQLEKNMKHLVSLYELNLKNQQDLQAQVQMIHAQNLPKIAAPVPPLSLRDQFRHEVNSIHRRTGLEHKVIVRSVYDRMFYSPYSINLQLQANNRGCAPIDILEDKELFPDALQILRDKYPDDTLF